jgi:transcriptional regulator with XRE-family HTH domain
VADVVDAHEESGQASDLMLTPKTCRAGRALAGLSQAELAEEANVGLSTVRSYELGTSEPRRNNLLAIERVLEAHGVIFIAADEHGGEGVRCRKGETE